MSTFFGAHGNFFIDTFPSVVQLRSVLELKPRNCIYGTGIDLEHIFNSYCKMFVSVLVLSRISLCGYL
jgi:hypothetical protein